MIPPPTIIRSKKRKRTVALSVEPDGSVVVNAPMRTSLSWINAFIVEKTAWIARRRAALAARQAQPPLRLQEDSLIPFLGKTLRLTLSAPVNLASTPPASTQSDDLITLLPLREGRKGLGLFGEGSSPSSNLLYLPLPLPPTPETLHDEIKTELTLWYKKQARRLFAERLAHWVKTVGFGPKRLSVTNPQKRWGSCSAKDEIRLNWRLIMASPEILDYVIVHELCHIPHKDHSKAFWGLVETFIPNAKKTRQQLRNFEKSAFLALFSK
ncbi:MAG: M48 family metallopeptidase [Bdellovibrionales bacterium]